VDGARQAGQALGRFRDEEKTKIKDFTMRITESKLRRIIREELLREARWRPEDLPSGMMVAITINDRRGALNIWVAATILSGTKAAGWIEATQRHLTSPCRGAFEVVWSKSIHSGLGPLLYDVAMEAATLLGGGLMSDRNEVSADARRVWQTYKNSRGDVEGLRLDSPENEKTPEVEEDNCSVDLAKKDSPEDWWEARHPLAQVYRIPGAPTIKRLKELGLLVVRGSLPGIGE
jgi:hypothetical protein